MEDAHLILLAKGYGVFGVFDGHGGGTWLLLRDFSLQIRGLWKVFRKLRWCFRWVGEVTSNFQLKNQKPTLNPVQLLLILFLGHCSQVHALSSLHEGAPRFSNGHVGRSFGVLSMCIAYWPLRLKEEIQASGCPNADQMKNLTLGPILNQRLMLLSCFFSLPSDRSMMRFMPVFHLKFTAQGKRLPFVPSAFSTYLWRVEVLQNR